MTRFTLSFSALAAGLAVIAPAAADPLIREPGKPVALTCHTQSIVIKDNGPAPTRGAVMLRLEIKEPASASIWTPVSADDAHKGAFATTFKTTCASGCPMSIPANGGLQLWAPSPKSLDKLGDDEVLLLAVIKPDTLSLKASTFRGHAIEALENGTCTVAP